MFEIYLDSLQLSYEDSLRHSMKSFSDVLSLGNIHEEISNLVTC